MESLYALFFIPELKDRKKISKIRSKMCKLCHTTQALQYPVHMSLACGTVLKDYSKFEKELKQFCKEQKSFIIHSEKNISVLPDRFWMGISIKKSDELLFLKNKVESLKNKHSIYPKKMSFDPHITLAFPAKVDNILPIENPITEIVVNRITIVRKEKKGEPYRIFKHIKFV